MEINQNIKNKTDVNLNILNDGTSSTKNKIIKNSSIKQGLKEQENKLNDTISSANSDCNSPTNEKNKLDKKNIVKKNTENNKIHPTNCVQLNSSNKDMKKQTNNIFKILSEKNSLTKLENNINDSSNLIINDNSTNIINNNNINSKNIFSITSSYHEKIDKSINNLNTNNNIHDIEDNFDCNNLNLLNNRTKDIKKASEINHDLNKDSGIYFYFLNRFKK